MKRSREVKARPRGRPSTRCRSVRIPTWDMVVAKDIVVWRAKLEEVDAEALAVEEAGSWRVSSPV